MVEPNQNPSVQNLLYHKFYHFIEKIWYPRPSYKISPLINILIFPLFWMLSQIYLILSWLRKKLVISTELPVKTVVVGNISSGGSGKTPFIIALAKELILKEINFAIVVHGYLAKIKDSTEVPLNGNVIDYGDEALLIKKIIDYYQNIPVYIGKSRVNSAKKILIDHPEVKLILFDDGIQDPSFIRNLEIILYTKSAIGNKLIIPAGPLREPMGNLAQANKYAHSRMVLATEENEENYDEVANKITGGIIFSDFLVNNYNNIKPLTDYKNYNWLYFAAFARPWRLLPTISEYTDSYYQFFYPNHFPLSLTEINSQLAKVNQDTLSNSIILITEKDAIKLSNTKDVNEISKISIPIIVISYTLAIPEKVVNKILETINEVQPSQS